MIDLGFYQNKKVLVTGHTGFKGTWLCKILLMAGADVIGFALDPPTEPSLYELSGIDHGLTDIRGDIRDRKLLLSVFEQYKPEIVFHLAAQPIVAKGYQDPAATYEVNMMGTVNLLESIRKTSSVKAFANITTDKVYRNAELGPLKETAVLDGFDPYSNSKSCSEFVTWTYRRSFPELQRIGIVTLRGGNVIGGGDFGDKRLLPDCVRAALGTHTVKIRNPHSSRPYQHVGDAIHAYLSITARVCEEPSLSNAYNIGPRYGSVETIDLVNRFCKLWKENTGENIEIINRDANDFKYTENDKLVLDVSSARETFGWESMVGIDEALDEVVAFTIALRNGKNIQAYMESVINGAPALVILAAGDSERFGAEPKQFWPLGQNGECLMEYSIRNAVRAGFGKVILVVRKALIHDNFPSILQRIGKETLVTCIYIDDDCEPRDLTGTGVSLLAAKRRISSLFAVINADDYYGPEAFGIMYRALADPSKMQESKNRVRISTVVYPLQKTLSPHGGVNRGICVFDSSGELRAVEETRDIVCSEAEQEISEEKLTTMNMWGGNKSFLELLEANYKRFQKSRQHESELDDEFVLTEAISELLKEGQLTIDALRTEDQWFGLTYREDAADAERIIKEMGL